MDRGQYNVPHDLNDCTRDAPCAIRPLPEPGGTSPTQPLDASVSAVVNAGMHGWRANHLRIARATYSWHVSRQADTFLRHDKQMSSCVTTNRFLLRHDWPDDKTRNGYGVPCISRATSSGLRVGSNLVLCTCSPSIDPTSQITGVTSHITGAHLTPPQHNTSAHLEPYRLRPACVCSRSGSNQTGLSPITRGALVLASVPPWSQTAYWRQPQHPSSRWTSRGWSRPLP